MVPFLFILMLTISLQISESLSDSDSRPLSEILHRYETLKKEHIQHSVVRRSIDGTGFEKHMSFRSHGRAFNMKIVPETRLFTDDFQAVSIDGQTGKESNIYIDKESFYSGYIDGDPKSSVEAHLENGVLTANVVTKGDTYIVEPSWRHIEHKHNFDMIVYKMSDIKWNLTHSNQESDSHHPTFCGVKNREKHTTHLKSDHTIFKREIPSKQSKNRKFVIPKNTCSLILVGDYYFFNKMGQKSRSMAANYMISVIHRVDKIYRATNWGSVGKNFGFGIRKVEIHDQPSSSNGPEHNQYKGKPWNVDNLLTSFSKHIKIQEYCLGHLFTYQDFDQGVIGLAYVGNANNREVGGVCSPPYTDGSGTMRSLRCGLSSSLNWGRRLLTKEADTVTAHELGHNFGADHDPETGTCAPNAINGGKFMMYVTSVSGMDPNNQQFSPCSKKSINDVLQVKQNCFTVQKGHFCGNLLVENDGLHAEQCDPGLEEKNNDGDKCCNKTCQFKPGAQCSDQNSLCCKNCQYAPSTQKCRESFTLACKGEAYCTGNSPDCPASSKLTGVECYGKGNCQNGVCKSFCHEYGKATCTCTASDVCKKCCSETNKTCNVQYKNRTIVNDNDGTPCQGNSFTGSCIKGKCQKTQQNVMDQFLSLLNDFTVDKFARFMQENIVGTILIFSLVLWIPGSCIVHFVDKRRDKEEEENQRWFDPKNTELIRRPSRDRNKVVFTGTPSSQPTGLHRNYRENLSPPRRNKTKDRLEFTSGHESSM